MRLWLEGGRRGQEMRWLRWRGKWGARRNEGIRERCCAESGEVEAASAKRKKCEENEKGIEKR